MSLEQVRGEVRDLSAGLRALKAEIELCAGSDDDAYAKKMTVRSFFFIFGFCRLAALGCWREKLDVLLCRSFF